MLSNPVEVSVFIGPFPVWEGRLSRRGWIPAEFTLRPSAVWMLSRRSSQHITVVVDRTWNPARAGVSTDERDLGAAITEVSWGGNE